MFDGAPPFLVQGDDRQDAFDLDGGNVFADAGLDAFENDGARAPVKATGQLDPEGPGQDPIDQMGPPRKVTSNDSGVAAYHAFDLAKLLHDRGPGTTRCILPGTFIFGDFLLAACQMIGPAHVRNHGEQGDVVYDPFLGSGTTMVAAENLHRRCRGMEVSPDYCAIILERMTTAFPHLAPTKINP